MMTSDDEKYMREALKQARLAYRRGEVPIGCVIVYDGRIIGRGYNRRNTDKCSLAHAEITAIRRASRVIGDWRLEECTLYVTLEPCQMCSGAIVQARIPRVIAGASSPRAGCAGSVMDILSNNEFNHRVEYTQGLLEDECSGLLKKFFTELRVRNKARKKMHYILDIDGTLWDTTDVVAVAWNDASEELGLGRGITGAMLQGEFGKPMDEIINDLFTDCDEEMQQRIGERVRFHEQIAVESCTDDLAYAGVREAIRYLAGEGYSLYIVSNCQAGYIELVMDKLGIREYITDYECFGVTGLGKADNIRLVCERCQIPPQDAIYVGDTQGDYMSATEAGVDFIYAAYGFGADTPPQGFEGRIIHSFGELCDF